MAKQSLSRIRQRPRLLLVHLLVLLVLGMSGCVTPDALVIESPLAPAPLTTPAAITAPATIAPYLEAALAHSPTATDSFAFTNWTLLKQVAGVPNLTSADSIEERLTFMSSLAMDEQALASSFGNRYFSIHAETWGWDSTDLLWEANLTLEGPPVYLLRFRDDFDFAPVLARLDERNYSTTEHGGTTLYSHEMDLGVNWLRTTELSILNIAVFEEEKLFALASAPDSVTVVLDAIAEGATLARLPAMRSVAAALGDASAAILTPLGCQPFDVASVLLRGSTEEIEETIEEMRQYGISGIYTVFGLGYRVETYEDESEEESKGVGTFVHHYPLAEQAEADLVPRRLVAETGTSLTTGIPFAELFKVIDAEVVDVSTGGANLILSLRTLNRPPQLFFNMFYQRDLLFSACGGF